MIVDRRRGLNQLIRESLPTLAVLFAWDIVVVICFQLFHRPWMDQPTLPYTLIGSALVLFLGVRNNNASARWWEARTLWGAVVNNCRNLARQCAALLGAERPDLARAIAGYAHALRAALARAPVDGDHTETLIGPVLAARIAGRNNRPNAILHELGREIAADCAHHGIDGAVLAGVDRILSDLANAQGGLERIRNTPLFIQFAVLPRLFVRIFCLVLPLSMVQELGWITPFGSTLVGLLFLALDDIGADLQDPFAPNVHGLPMRAMATTIEIDVLQGIGETAPAPIAPEDGVLF